MIKILTSAVLLGLSLQAYASVAVFQGLGGSWVGTPTIMVANDPAVNLDSAESDWGSSAPYSLGQTFTATVSGTLTNIQVYVTGKNTTNVLYLYDMGPTMQYQSTAQPSPIIPGSNNVTTVVGGNLLSSNLWIEVTNQSNPSVAEFVFSGADAVPIVGGHLYYFTMVSLSSGSQMYWYRDGGGTDLYPGGAAYRQNSLINGSETTDFSLAVTLSNTNAAAAIYDSVIDWNNIHQRIDGFGASSAWRSTWTANEANMFFSTNSGTGTSIDGTTNFPFNGIGLSLLRSRIAPGGTTVENSIMQMAQARGATVWSTPWSPAVQFKSNDNVDGGDFMSASNQAYANQLAGYVVSMKNTYGVNISAISVQNEPDVSQDYESCIWTSAQIDQFVPYLHSALVASNVASTKIIVAEDEYWETNYYATTMMDPAAAPDVGIVACHDYSGTPPNDMPVALPRYDNTNAAEWETETAELSGVGAFNPSMTDAIYWAGRIHLFMTVANANAFHYWWLISGNPDNEGLTDTNGIPAQRMYVLGQYSRFVRPGNYRIDLANYNPYSVLASAYKDPVADGFAVVVANTNTTATTQSFYLTNFTATTVTPWITSSNQSLAVQSPITVTNSAFSYAIPGMSVVTFVGTGQVSGGTLTPNSVPTQNVSASVTLLVTNTATGGTLPLNWTLQTGPTNAALTSAGLFSWTPLSSQAGTTNLITVEVKDSGTPAQTTNNSFYVMVNSLTGTVPITNTLNLSANTLTYGTAVTFTATVYPWPTNGETVVFMSGSTTFGTGTLNNGVATYTTTATQLAAAGSPYSVTAIYGGDGYYQSSASAAVPLTVTAATVTVASGLTVNSRNYNDTATATISSNNVILSGVVAGDVPNVSLFTNGYTALFASPNAGNDIAVTVSGLILSGSAAGNYNLIQPALSGSITPEPVTLAVGSGSLKITNNFTSANDQFEVYNGPEGFSPALSGALFTNFQCDVRFAPGSATQTNNSGVLIFGHLQFGTSKNYDQDYFGGSSYGIDVPATNTGWVHISIPISVASDSNLTNIYDVLIHIYGPTYTTTLTGPSTLWVDNIAFVGAGTNYIVDQFNPAGSGGNSYSAGQLINVWYNWFGGAWATNTWDATNDAIGVAANNKVYDGTTNATITQYDTLINAALSGVLSGDLLNVSLSTNGYAASFASAGAGTNIAVTVTGLTLAGSEGANYTIPPLTTLSANISGSTISPTVTTLSSYTNNAAYGTAVTFTATVNPPPTNGETVAFMTGGADLGTGLLNGGMASYTTTGAQLTVAGSPYSVTAVYDSDGYYQSSSSTAVLQTVTAATVTVKANNESRTFGLPNLTLTANYNGLANGEGTNVLTMLASLTTTANVNSPAGGYLITASGATAPNYVFSYVPGTLTVMAVPALAITAGATGYQLTFPTLMNQTYQMEYKTNLTDAAWTPLGDPIPGTGSPLSVTNTFGEPQGFYMLQISQP